MRVGEALVRLLEAYEVDTVFGVPGTHSLELYRGLARSSLRHVSPRHEQGGAFMADGYARVSGKPGVCFVITGPGVTNVTTPLGEAYLDSVPLLVISPVNTPDPAGRNRGRLHEITRQSAVTAPLTAFSVVIRDAEEIPLHVARAFAVFSSPRPLPVHISIPLPVLSQPITTSWAPRPPPAKCSPPIMLLRSAARMLDRARRPVLVAGGRSPAAAAATRALAEKLSAPLITTIAGRGIIGAEHPLCPGAQLRSPSVQSLLGSADVALLLGTGLAPTEHYADPLILPARQIRVNPDCEVPPDSGETLSFCADLEATVGELLDATHPASPARAEWALAACRSVKGELSSGRPVNVCRHLDVLRVLLDELPADAQVVSDMTQIAYTAVELLPWTRSGGWLHPSGYGTLGYALPAAIGAKIAAPRRKVLALVGDAGLQYTMQELTVAAELRQDLILLLWNNDTLQQIRDDMDAAGIEHCGVVQRNPDFLALAGACGWASAECDSLDGLREQLRVALGASHCPTLIKLNERSLG